MNRLREFRWAIITLVGALYCFLAPQFYYWRRK